MKEFEELEEGKKIDQTMLAEAERLQKEKQKEEQELKDNIFGAVKTCFTNLMTILPNDHGYDMREDPVAMKLAAPESEIDSLFKKDSIKVPIIDYAVYGMYENGPLEDTIAEYKKDTVKELKVLDDYMLKLQEEGVLSSKTADFLRAIGMEPARDAVDVNHLGVMTGTCPIALGYGNIVGAMVNLGPTTEKLNSNIEKWNDKFPIYETIIESQKQVHTFARYMKAKEEGKLDPEGERKYRQKFYLQTVKLLRLTEDMDKAVEDPEIDAALRKDQVLQNDPVNVHSYFNRGHGFYRAMLEAYKEGIESGWSLEDLGVISDFKSVLFLSKNEVETNKRTGKIRTYSDFEFYDVPHYTGWKSDKDRAKQKPEEIERDLKSMQKHKDFLDKMDQLYVDMVSGKPTPETRAEYLRQMKETVAEGVKAGYISNAHTAYFNRLTDNLRVRDLKVAAGAEDAASIPVPKNLHERSAERLRIDKLIEGTGERIPEKKQSPAYKELTRSALQLKKLTEIYDKMKNGRISLKDEEKERFAERYFLQLEDLECKLRKYRKDGADPKLQGAANRLNVVTKFERYAMNLKEAFYLEMRHADIIPKGSDMESYRMGIASGRMSKAMDKMERMQGMPKDVEELRSMMLSAADILVGNMGMHTDPVYKKVVKQTGLSELKYQILDDKDFRKMIRDALKDGSMTPAKLAEQLSQPKTLDKLKKLKVLKTKTAKLTNPGRANRAAQQPRGMGK